MRAAARVWEPESVPAWARERGLAAGPVSGRESVVARAAVAARVLAAEQEQVAGLAAESARAVVPAREPTVGPAMCRVLMLRK